MSKFCSIILTLIVFIHQVPAQSTSQRVYEIFQTSCTFSSCHDNNNPVNGLDLEGAGPNAMMEVYDNIVNVNPTNAYASSHGYPYIDPGNPKNSFLFRKINDGLDPLISLHSQEGGDMPQTGTLEETEIELVRQWILYGAPAEGTVIDESLIESYYNDNGIASVPSPPPPPDEGEGFQVHLGPFFVAPGEEDEVFLKYDPQLPEDLEVTVAEVFMGSQSHHFLLFRFFAAGETLCGMDPGSGAVGFSDGYRGVENASHLSALFQAGTQYSDRFEAPYKTAFFWDKETILDLNSHYINSSQSSVLSGDVYVNFYTQPSGTALQELHSAMVPNLEFNIPNNGQVHTLEQNLPIGFCDPDGAYLYAITCHTHALGIDYDIYKSNILGQELDHIYDGSCGLTDGEPGCDTEFYDYQHPPIRYLDDYYHLKGTDWVKHRASFINNGPEDVGFGYTSTDEMMMFFIFYVDDTTGLTPLPTNVAENTAPELIVYPNPSSGKVLIDSGNEPVIAVNLINSKGMVRDVQFSEDQGSVVVDLSREDLPGGIYWLSVLSSNGKRNIAASLVYLPDR